MPPQSPPRANGLRGWSKPSSALTDVEILDSVLNLNRERAAASLWEQIGKSRIYQFVREYILFNVVRTVRADMFHICRRSVLRYLNHFKCSQKSVDLDPIPLAGSFQSIVHTLIMQSRIQPRHTPKASIGHRNSAERVSCAQLMPYRLSGSFGILLKVKPDGDPKMPARR